MKLKALITTTLLTAPIASAQLPQQLPNNYALLVGATVLQCNFDEGRTASWDNRTLKTKTASLKSVGTVTFDAINYQEGSARFIANNGAESVFAFRTPAGATFIEKTGSGNVVTTTVFANTVDVGTFVAVTSRHMSMFNMPMPSQYHGTCRVKG